jgi:hypothetical protein
MRIRECANFRLPALARVAAVAGTAVLGLALAILASGCGTAAPGSKVAAASVPGGGAGVEQLEAKFQETERKLAELKRAYDEQFQQIKTRLDRLEGSVAVASAAANAAREAALNAARSAPQGVAGAGSGAANAGGSPPAAAIGAATVPAGTPSGTIAGASNTAAAGAAAPAAGGAVVASAAATGPCDIREATDLGGRTGRLIIQFAGGADTSGAPIAVRAGEDQGSAMAVSKYGELSAELLPGKYRVEITGRLAGVFEVKARHETRVHTGVVRFKLSEGTPVALYAPGQKTHFHSFYGPCDVGLPVGDIEVGIAGGRERMVVERDKVQEF